MTIAMKIFRKCGTCVEEYIVKSPPNGCGDDHDGARLHRHRDEPLLHVALLDRVRRHGERGVDRAEIGNEIPRVRTVRTEIGVDEHSVGTCVLEVEDDRKVVVFDDHLLGRVASRFAVSATTATTTVSDVAHLVDARAASAADASCLR